MGKVPNDWRKGLPFPDGTWQYGAVTDEDRERWNEAYAHSLVEGNPHKTTWEQLLNKPSFALEHHTHVIPDVIGLAEALAAIDFRVLDPVTGKRWRLEIVEVDGVPHLRPVNPI